MAGTRCTPCGLGAVIGLAALLGLGASAAAQQKVGVGAAVDQTVEGTPPNAVTRRLELGQEVVYNERVVTGQDGQTQVVFLDASALTIGPNSDMTIDSFVFNPNTSSGQLAMSATRGVMRFVGGKISKLENGVTMNTPSGFLGIRGGVFLLYLRPTGQLEVVFLYGKSLTVTLNGQTKVLTRPGWYVAVAGPAAVPSEPAPASTETIAFILSLLSGRPGASGGSLHPPRDQDIVNSGLPPVISGNILESTNQANDNRVPPKGNLPIVNVSTLQGTFQINTVAMQPVVAAVSQGPGNSSAAAVTPLTPTLPPTTPIVPPNIPFPTTGVGSFTGTAMGTVAGSPATGNFSQIYNFGSGTGTVGISNFAGATYNYGVRGSGASFSGTLTGGTGSLTGSFSGLGATQTNGSFNAGTSVSGTFSGR